MPKKTKEGFEKVGAYLLGTKEKNEKFLPRYVGSSYTDLRSEIRKARDREWADGVKRNANFNFVKISVKNTNKQAWEKECRWFHYLKDTNKLTNSRHPKREENKNWKCPIKDCCEDCN